MPDLENDIKKKAKTMGKKVAKKILLILLPILLIFMLLAAAVYFITIDDGTYKEGDWGNTNYGASQYVNNVEVNTDGKISSTTNAQDLWKKMKDNGSDVDKYLDKPEELLKLMNAEVVTQYPDLRKDPDKKIDWDKVLKESDSLQGIIKFKRAGTDNTKTTMTYVDQETFQGYIDEYNKTGSETAKQNALSHFTLKKTKATTSTTKKEEVAAGDGAMTDVSQAIIDATNSTPWPGESYCLRWVNDVYENAGLFYQLAGRPLQALEMYEKADSMERMVSILIDNARKSANSAYYYELKKYYLALSEEIVKKSPELMCGMSMLQSLLLNPEESERWYSELQAFADSHQGSIRKVAKNNLLYLEIGLPHRGSADMISIMKNAYRLVFDRQATLGEFSVTSNQPSMMNGGKDFCEWSKKDRELAGKIGKLVEFVLGKYGKGLINLALAESFFEKGEDNYEVAVLANKGRMQAEAGGKIEQCFVADGILAWLHIINGKVQEAEEVLRSFYEKAEKEGAVKLLPNIQTFLARCALYKGEWTEVNRWMDQTVDENVEFSIYDRFIYLTKVRVYIQRGKYEQAYSLLVKLQYYAEVMKRTYIQIECRLLMAITMYRMGNKAWREELQAGIKEAADYHFVRVISREGAAVYPLLRALPFVPEEVEDDPKLIKKNRQYHRQVMKETESVARSYPGYLKMGKAEVRISETGIRIIKLLAEGFSRIQIAEQLNMTEANVKYHMAQTYKKLGVKDKAGAVMEAKNRNLI